MTTMSVQQRRELGRSKRAATPRSAHATWEPGPDRADPVALIEEQNASRLEWLVPIRHARMSVSPFTFFRGAARVMASDLAGTPSTGLEVQLGGDAHLSNFGAYASPERQLVFDQNDFDETLPGPWEWDLKRLATSFVIAGQFHGFSKKHCGNLAAEVTRSYRRGIAHFAAMGYVQLWYDYVDTDDIRSGAGISSKELDKRLTRFTRRAEKRTSAQALGKYAERVDGRWRIRHEPPLLFSLSDLPGGMPAGWTRDELPGAAAAALEAYKGTLDDNRHALLDHYDLVEVGLKVVGVGSVGTRCLLLLLLGRDDGDPLFLQAKEATNSVLEEFLAPSRYDNHGQRVVEGQRLVQAQSDIFLGWTVGAPEGRHFYVRQLRDWKGSVDVEAPDTTPEQLGFYAGLCGLTLARGHARTGDAEAIAGYVGKGESLDRAIAEFAHAYAATNLEDHQRFCAAIDHGALPCGETA